MGINGQDGSHGGMKHIDIAVTLTVIGILLIIAIFLFKRMHIGG